MLLLCVFQLAKKTQCTSNSSPRKWGLSSNLQFLLRMKGMIVKVVQTSSTSLPSKKLPLHQSSNLHSLARRLKLQSSHVSNPLNTPWSETRGGIRALIPAHPISNYPCAFARLHPYPHNSPSVLIPHVSTSASGMCTLHKSERRDGDVLQVGATGIGHGSCWSVCVVKRVNLQR